MILDLFIQDKVQGDDWEYVDGLGFSKAVDVTSSSEVDGMQTWEDIESGLAMAMQNEFDDIKANWNDVEGMSDSEIEDWLATTFDLPNDKDVNHLKNLTLDPIFTIHDERYFDVLNRSTHANVHIDMSKLYDYYDVEQGRITDLGNSNNNNGNSNNNNGGSDPVEGCMDSTALNYNSQADVDDGSCTFSLTVSVDMSQQTVAAEGAYIMGDQSNWSPTAMVDQGNGVYSFTATGLSAGDYAYKFLQLDFFGSFHHPN